MSVRYRTFASVLSVVTLIGAILVPLTSVVIWLFWEQLAPLAARNLPVAFDLTTLSTGSKLAGFALTFAGGIIQAYGLLGLRTTFSEAAGGNPLSDSAIRGFRRFAWVILVMVFVGIVQQTGLIVIFSLSDPAHQGMLSIQLGSNELKSLFIGLLLVFVAHIFTEGKRAKDENEAFL